MSCMRVIHRGSSPATSGFTCGDRDRRKENETSPLMRLPVGAPRLRASAYLSGDANQACNPRHARRRQYQYFDVCEVRSDLGPKQFQRSQGWTVVQVQAVKPTTSHRQHQPENHTTRSLDSTTITVPASPGRDPHANDRSNRQQTAPPHRPPNHAKTEGRSTPTPHLMGTPSSRAFTSD